MKRLFVTLIAVALGFMTLAQVGTIENIYVEQRDDGTGMVDISFDLTGLSTAIYNISLEASFDAGDTFNAIDNQYLIGDFEEQSPAANLTIVWDGLGSHPNVFSEEAVLKIVASWVDEDDNGDNDMPELLAGEVSKTWKLYRVGESMGVGPDLENSFDWWILLNDGSRPCVYLHEFTFHQNGQYVFDDKGVFWGEYGVFGGVGGQEDTPFYNQCFEAIPENMVNVYGADVSAWLSGTHQFEFEASTNTVTLTGEGAWIGVPKLGTNGEHDVPQSSVSFQIEIEEREGYDHMSVYFGYDDYAWTFHYAHYHDPSLEPPIIEEEEGWGENLPNITPAELYHTFESETSFAHIGAIGGASVINVGYTDPAGGATNVGQFVRVGGIQWQEAHLITTPEWYDIQFDNFDIVKIDVYIPADTDFEGTDLQKFFVLGFADMSETEEWWNSPVQFIVQGDNLIVGAWQTYEFDLTDVKERDDLDTIYIGIGGGGHTDEGTFYLRNLIFE